MGEMMATEADQMRSDPGTKPNPDPTVATNDAVERAVKAERDYVNGMVGVLDERLDGMDKATSLLSETVNRVPTEVTKEVGHLHSLMDEKFTSIATQFAERDTRQEREARDNKVAVDAAFAAQKEAAAKQDESNAKAIDKSERATAETISKLEDLFTTKTDGLGDKIDDIKARVDRMEARGIGVSEQREDARVDRADVRGGTSLLIAGVSVAVAILLLLVSLYAISHRVTVNPTITIPATTTP